MHPPPAPVLEAFGLQETSPRLLPGGQGTTWHAGECILKPVDLTESELCWQAGALNSLTPAAFRISAPQRSLQGAYLVDGWAAWTFLPGRHEPGRWVEILQVADEFHRALAPLSRPAFLDARRDPWAQADRVAWEEQPLPVLRNAAIQDLAGFRRAVQAPSQLIHGDLTGNVLFQAGEAPAVIDLSLYWRSPAYAAGIVVADALVWEGASAALLIKAAVMPDFAQCFLRALLFRLVTDELLTGGAADTRAYERAIKLACGLVDP